MKAVEIRGMSPAELNTKLEDLKKSCSTCAFSTPPIS